MKRPLKAIGIFTFGIWMLTGGLPPVSAQSAYTCLAILNEKTEAVTIKVQGYNGLEWTIRPNAPSGTVLSNNSTPLHQTSFTVWVYWRGANISQSVTWRYDRDATDTTAGTNRCDGEWIGTVQ